MLEEFTFGTYWKPWLVGHTENVMSERTKVIDGPAHPLLLPKHDLALQGAMMAIPLTTEKELQRWANSAGHQMMLPPPLVPLSVQTLQKLVCH